jgi:hypothetical protein
MSIKLYDPDWNYTPAQQRKIAVEAALDLIHADCMGGSSDKLVTHLDKLPEYVGKIQAVLKVEIDSKIPGTEKSEVDSSEG